MKEILRLLCHTIFTHSIQLFEVVPVSESIILFEEFQSEEKTAAQSMIQEAVALWLTKELRK